MKAKILIPGVIIAIIATIVVACKKDQFTTKPQITVKSVNSDVVPSNGRLVFDLEFTDKEGDIKDTIWAQKKSLHCTDPDDADPFIYKIPDDVQETKNMKGEIEIAFEPPPICINNSADPDTCYFRFWMQDRARNVSDTVNSGTIVIVP